MVNCAKTVNNEQKIWASHQTNMVGEFIKTELCDNNASRQTSREGDHSKSVSFTHSISRDQWQMRECRESKQTFRVWWDRRGKSQVQGEGTERDGENGEKCGERKSDKSTMKFDRRMNTVTTMKRPEAYVRSVILCPSAQRLDPDHLEGCQLRRRGGGGGGSRFMSRWMCVCVCLEVVCLERQRDRAVKTVLCGDQSTWLRQSEQCQSQPHQSIPGSWRHTHTQIQRMLNYS